MPLGDGRDRAATFLERVVIGKMASRKRRFLAGGTGILFIILLLLLLLLEQYGLVNWRSEHAIAPAEGELAVHFIDVGQGDAILIQAPGKSVLIDGGPRDAASDLTGYLRRGGITRLDLVISTHPHEDHIGGLPAVLEAFSVGEVIDPAVPHTTQTFEQYLALIEANKITFTAARSGLTRDLGGGALLRLLHPAAPDPEADLNNCSVVARLSFGKISFLFTGDIESLAEREILQRERHLATTILKVAHHGSKTSTDPLFLDAVSPAVAVICYGENQYGLPHPDTLDNLAKAGAVVYSTAQNGTIRLLTDGHTYTVHTERS